MKKILKKILFYPFIVKKITKFLLIIHRLIYTYIGTFATAYENGVHPKHRLTNYHKFFVENISEKDTVLDVGCSDGRLLREVVSKTKAPVVGVDISKNRIDAGKKKVIGLKNVELIHTDIWDYQDNRIFNTIILSNVLEHLDNRVKLLKHLTMQFKPKQFLIRVPMFEREWIVPYKKELGIDYRLESTHKIEYTEDEFRDELRKAGLDVLKIICKWGEIWSIAVPSFSNLLNH